MRLVTFGTASRPRLGLVQDDMVIDLAQAAGEGRFPPDVLGLIAAGPGALKKAARLAKRAPSSARKRLSRVNLLAPIPQPRRNIFCLGMNYAEHARESMEAKGQQYVKPEHPVFFSKTTTAVTGPYADIPWDGKVMKQLDWEVELAIVIGPGGKNIRRKDALQHVFGYMVLNDLSARDLQFQHQQYFKGKSIDGCCPMGPWIVTADEIPNPHKLALRSRVNGKTKQESNTNDMIFDVPTTISVLSQGLTLLPGDVIATGTPSGVGFARTPPQFLKPGHVVECEVEGVGTIRNKIVR